MKTVPFRRGGKSAALDAAVGALAVGRARARIAAFAGATFTLTAKTGVLESPGGGAVLFWGYAADDGEAQYPGPRLIVNQGDVVTVCLANRLPVRVSIVFPGQEAVSAAGGLPGVSTDEAPADDGATVVTYTFVARRPGTYVYHSGTHPEYQVDMGLLGELIVRALRPVTQRRGRAGTLQPSAPSSLLSLVPESVPG